VRPKFVPEDVTHRLIYGGGEALAVFEGQVVVSTGDTPDLGREEGREGGGEGEGEGQRKGP